jgi:hypothetical protein
MRRHPSVTRSADLCRRGSDQACFRMGTWVSFEGRSTPSSCPTDFFSVGRVPRRRKTMLESLMLRRCIVRQNRGVAYRDPTGASGRSSCRSVKGAKSWSCLLPCAGPCAGHAACFPSRSCGEELHAVGLARSCLRSASFAGCQPRQARRRGGSLSWNSRAAR